MRSIWSGSISFGLVNIPIKLYSASVERQLNFDLLHKNDLSRIRYARICELEEKEVPFEEIVKGYEYSKGYYIVLEKDDFLKADVKASHSIEVVNFVDSSEIEAVYFQKPYFLEPESSARRAYALFREALKNTGKVAIGKFVLRNKENLCILRPYNNVISLITLRFPEEIRSEENLNLPSASEADHRELEIAEELIGRIEKPLDLTQYKDTYSEKILQLINQKAKGVTPSSRGYAPVPTPVTDLMAALRQSIEEQEKREPVGTRK